MPEIFSSAKSFSSPILRERRRNSGLVRVVIKRVMRMLSGMVMTNTSTSMEDRRSIIISEPKMVIKLARMLTTSVDREVLMVSIS